MRYLGTKTFCAALVVLVVTAGGFIVNDAATMPERRARAAEFQRLAAGLGFGPSVDLFGCEFSFDPRVCSHCEGRRETIAGDAYLCRHHAASVFSYPAPIASRIHSPQ